MNHKPFQIAIPQAQLDELKNRLAQTRWPEPLPNTGWQMGTDLRHLQNLVKYWHNTYDWRIHEAALNQLPQFIADVNGVSIHFVHMPSQNPNATPLILTHGWPDTFHRFSRVIPLLASTFSVVVPSIPGFSFSEKRALPSTQIADLWANLMTQELGYPRFMAAGGDVGGPVTLALARRHPDNVTGIHLTDVGYPTGQETDFSSAEQEFAQFIQGWWMRNGAYAMVQSTAPESVGVALDDSPAGLAAWMLNLINTGANQHEVEAAFGGQDELLTNFSLYWFTRTATSAARSYWAEAQAAWGEPSNDSNAPATVPTGFLLAPREAPTPQDWVNRHSRLLRYTTAPRGGHFLALEEPELYAQDLIDFHNEL